MVIVTCSMRLSSEDDEDDYYLDDDFEDEAPKKGLFSKRNNTEPEDEPEGQEKPKFLGRSNPKVVPMRRSMEVTMIKPTSMDDSRDICDYLLSGKAVVLNMEGIHMETAQRIIDFTSGATYSMNGNLQKVGARMGGKTSTASKRKFNDKTYQRIVLDVRMDVFPNKEAVQMAAQKAGQSLTEYIMEAVRLRMQQENVMLDTPGVVKNLEGDTDPVE